MSSDARIEAGGAELIPGLQSLWEALFDHHVSVGGAGLPTVERERSWPLRRAHYERLFAGQPWAAIWVVRADERVIGYALGYEDRVGGRRAAVLETLSVLPEARGGGIGAELMRLLDARAAAEGIGLGAVDVLGGNARARSLYLRTGYEPLSENWMRTEPAAAARASGPQRSEEELVVLAAAHGFDLAFSPGPDDTWVSSERIASLDHRNPEAPVPEGFEALLGELGAAGVWTIRVELPAEPRAAELRGALAAAGFRLATERLSRELRD